MAMKWWLAMLVSGAATLWIPPALAQDGAKPGDVVPKTAAGQATRSGGANIFDLGKEKAQRIVVTLGAEVPEVEEATSAMLRELAGVAADLRGKQIDELRACVPPNPMLGDVRGAQP